MKHEATRDLFRYWDSLRGSRTSPDRDEIDPGAIRHVLADTFLLEARSNGTFPLRLSGTRFDAFWLGARKGQCFLERWADDRHSVSAALWTVMDGAIPLVIGAKGAPPGRPPVDIEGIFLPLRHGGKTHARILGALSVASPPPWIGLAAVDLLQLVSLRVITSPGSVALPRMDTKVRTVPSPIARRGHLTIYAGGR